LHHVYRTVEAHLSGTGVCSRRSKAEEMGVSCRCLEESPVAKQGALESRWADLLDIT
jgi:hypothetical protein